MEVEYGNLVTTLGTSEPQGSAMVSGPGVYTGSQVAGSPGSSTGNREGTEVDSQVSVIPSTTSAEIPNGSTSSRLQAKLIAANSTKKSSTQIALVNLKSMMKQQNKIINCILAATEHLQICKDKSKSPTIIEVIEGVTEATESLRECTGRLHNAFYETEMALNRETNEKKTVTDTATPTLVENREAINELRGMMERQGAILEGLSKQVGQQYQQTANRPSYASQARAYGNSQQETAKKKENETGTPHQGQETQSWTKVTRKRTPAKTTGKSLGQNPKIPRKLLSDSIAVKPENGETYSGILKEIKEKVDIESIGSQVASITESRSGEILIRLKPEDKKREELLEALKANLGERAAIRGLVRHDDLDVQDLYGVTTEAEVETCIKSILGLALDDTSIKTKSIRQTYAGTQRATVRLRSTDALKLVKNGRIKIGWVYAKVRLKTTATRCFKCLGYGHTKYACKGPDRTNACSLCSSVSHKASDCKSSPNCVACMDLLKPTDHYPGSTKCTAYRTAMDNKRKHQTMVPRESGKEPDAPN